MEGDAVDMILRAAAETRSDLIVMGTHGSNGVAAPAGGQRGRGGVAQGTLSRVDGEDSGGGRPDLYRTR